MLSHFIPSIITTSFDAFGAIGSGGGVGVTETVSLAGTSGAPQSFFGPFPQYIGLNGTDWYTNTGFVFKTDGNIYRQQATTGSGTLFSSTNWNNTTPSTTYYIRFTNDNTGLGSQLTPNNGDALNTWHALSIARSFSYTDNAAFGSYGYVFIQCKVEIASDAAGTNILATGYYKAEWEGGA